MRTVLKFASSVSVLFVASSGSRTGNVSVQTIASVSRKLWNVVISTVNVFKLIGANLHVHYRSCVCDGFL
jgi:hypothetical protein